MIGSLYGMVFPTNCSLESELIMHEKREED